MEQAAQRYLGEGVLVDFNTGSFVNGNDDAVFTVDQESAAILRNGEKEFIQSKAIHAGDSHVEFRGKFEMLSFDVKEMDPQSVLQLIG